MGDKRVPKFLLHSPVGADPLSFSWPLITGTGTDRHDAGQDIIDTVRWVCEEMPEIKSALDDVKFMEVDTSSYDAMKNFCERYNRAADSVVALVSTSFYFIFCY